MSNLTSELNLSQAVDADDTADYLTVALSDSLDTIDGMFAAGTGHAHNGSHQGAPINPASFPDGSIPASKLAVGTLVPEAVYANTVVNSAANYTVAGQIMWVFCTAAVTVTLPLASATNRPITVIAVAGQSAVNAAGGSVIGGSAHPTTGAIQNGVVAAGEAFTYKSDLTNWRAC